MKQANNWNISPESIRMPLIMLTVFVAIAIISWKLSDNSYMLFNFLCIGSAVSMGIFLNQALPRKHILWGRRITLFLVGTYLLVIVGSWNSENIQIEAFFASILTGALIGAAFIHIAVAKIAGPMVFNRGWCGWACWTVMILDLLPWKRSKNGRLPYWGGLRYVIFIVSFIVAYIFIFVLSGDSIIANTTTALQWFIAGNVIYYVVGIASAAFLKDNRAFCKYLCPLTVLLKAFSRFSFMKIKVDDDGCDECGVCEKMCPMDIKILEYKKAGQRVLSTECILCIQCINSCARDVIDCTGKFDVGGKEYLKYKQ